MTTQPEVVPSIVMFALHRGGGSITARLLQLALASVGFRLFDEGKRYYQAGYSVDEMPQSFFDGLAPRGAFHGPFRTYPLTMRLANLASLTRILVIRDPRDCLVSSFYALHGPHDRGDMHRARERLPTQLDAEEGIDDFCFRAAERMRSHTDSLRLLCLHYPDTLVFRYEDIYADPMAWLRGVIERLGIQVAAEALDQARVEAVFTTDTEDASRHHRQGHPGDHLRKLRRQTAIYLAELLAPQLAFFGYHGAVAAASAPILDSSRPTEHAGTAAAEFAALKRIVSELQRENGFRIREIAELRDAVRPVATLRDTIDALATRAGADISDHLYG
jgi:hypothetical protein